MDGNRFWRDGNSDPEHSSSEPGVIRNDSESSDLSRDLPAVGQSRRREEGSGASEPQIQPDDSHRRQGELFNALFRHMRDAEPEKQSVRRQPPRLCQTMKPKYQSAEEAIREQKLIRERHLILKQQRIREQQEQEAEQALREQEALRERLSNRRRRPAAWEQQSDDTDDDDDDEEEEEEEEEEDEEEEEEEEGEEGGEEESEEGGEVEVEEESDEVDGEDGDDEAEYSDNDEEGEIPDSDSADNSPTLYTWNEHRARYKKKRTSTYLRRLAGLLPIPGRRFGGSPVQMSTLTNTGGSEPQTEGPSTSQATRSEGESSPRPMPLWKRFSYVKDDDFEARLRSREDPHPEPIMIRNSLSNSDKGSLDGEHKVQDCSSTEDAVNRTNAEYHRLLVQRAQMQKIEQPKRRLFGQMAPRQELAPIQEVTDKLEQKDKSENQRYMSEQPSTSKAADEADAEMLRLTRRTMNPDWTPANSQEHMSRTAEEESNATRDLVSPEEYYLDIDVYTDNLLHTAARQCQLLQTPFISWMRERNVDPHMQRFLSNLPSRPVTHHRPPSAPIKVTTAAAAPGHVSASRASEVLSAEATTSRLAYDSIASSSKIAADNVGSSTTQERDRNKILNTDKPVAVKPSADRSIAPVADNNPPGNYRSLFFNPVATTQSVPAEQFVFGQWSAAANQSVTTNNQSAAIQSTDSSTKIFEENTSPNKTKKRKRNDDDDDKDEEDSRRRRSTSPSKLKKRRQLSDDEASEKDGEKRKKRQTSTSPRKRKHRDDSSHSREEVKRKKT